MIRFTVVMLLALILPTAIFFSYRAFLIYRRKIDGEAFSLIPYHKLFVAGGVLAILAFLFLAFNQENVTNRQYIPAHMKDGQLIPGGFVDREPSVPEE